MFANDVDQALSLMRHVPELPPRNPLCLAMLRRVALAGQSAGPKAALGLLETYAELLRHTISDEDGRFAEVLDGFGIPREDVEQMVRYCDGRISELQHGLQ
jgi:hypothetical protein